MSLNSLPRIIRFSTFEVNLQTGELRRRGQKVKLQGQPFQVLATLLERPGEIVRGVEIVSELLTIRSKLHLVLEPNIWTRNLTG